MKNVLFSSDHETLNALADRIFATAKAFGHNDDDESLLLISQVQQQ
jgi:hypothetical protein